MKNLNFINKTKNKSGFSPIIVIIIVVLVLAAGVYYFFFVKSPAKKGQTKIEKSLADLKVESPQLDLSLSPIPKLQVSSLNVAAPNLPATNIFSGFSVDTNFSYNPAVNISAPNIQFSLPSIPQIQIPTGQPSGGALQQQLPAGVPQQPSTNQPSSQPGVEQQSQPRIDCSMFSAAPSCSYIGAPGSSAYEACKQCYPNK